MNARQLFGVLLAITCMTYVGFILGDARGRYYAKQECEEAHTGVTAIPTELGRRSVTIDYVSTGPGTIYMLACDPDSDGKPMRDPTPAEIVAGKCPKAAP